MKKLLLILIPLLPLLVAGQNNTYLFKGAIDSVYFYHGELNVEPGGKLSGRYKYDSQTEWITLGGVTNDDGSWTVYEYAMVNGQAIKNSVFNGKLNENRLVTGAWHKLEDKFKEFPFYFKPAQNMNEVSTLCTNAKFFSTNLANYPRRMRRAYLLTSELDEQTGSVIWFDQSYQNHFSIDFDFSNSRSTRWSAHPDETADGMCLILFKDKSAMTNTTIPVGRDKTFIKDGTGLGVYFNLYLERAVQVINGKGDLLCSNSVELYTESEWQHATVEVDGNVVTVTVEGNVVLHCNVPSNFQRGTGFGIGASTGGVTATQMVKNVTITRR